MCFCTARAIRNEPRRWTCMTRSQSASVILNSRLSRVTPALLTSTTGGPSSSAIRATAPRTCSASPPSAPPARAPPPAPSLPPPGPPGPAARPATAPTASARPPAPPIASPVPGASSADRSTTAMANPSAASRWAVAAPMPRAAPVTIATREAPPLANDSLMVGSDPLEQRGQALPAADAHGLQPEPCTAAVHLPQQRRQDPATGRADRVAQRDPGAVDVHALEVGRREAPLLGHREDLAGERLVELDQVDVLQLDAGLRQGLGGRRHGADAHRPRRHPAHAPRDQPGQRPQPELGRLVGVGDGRDRRPVVLPAGVAGGGGGPRGVPAHDRGRLRKGLDVGGGPGVAVAGDPGGAPAAPHRHPGDAVGATAPPGG